MAASHASHRARGRSRRAPVQLELPGTTPAAKTAAAKKGWGGSREGSGRPRRLPGGGRVPHVAREPHKARHPVHVTLRARLDLPSFRAQLVEQMIREVLRRQKTRAYERGFQLPHFSIQADHLHLIVEADEHSLRAGVSGFAISFARQLNRLLGRKGSVWSDRYHRHDLGTPTEVRNVLR